jgi:hypothetical protein
MWDWRPGDAERAHKYAMKHADQDEFDEYERILDPDFDELDLVQIVRKLVAA